MTTTTMTDLLSGLTVGKVQAVGSMALIPLIGQDDERFAPVDVLMVSNRNYGHLRFRNTDTRPTIVPTSAGWLTKKRNAQDHATPQSVVVGAGGSSEIEDAFCIEQSQGGYMREGDEHRFVILPGPLREAALIMRNQHEYGRLWNEIARFGEQMGLRRMGGHLNQFLAEYDRQLELFLAEFEIVDGQVGAIILVNGKVVGVERVPNHAYWCSVWEPLIRECYGSLVEHRRRAGEAERPPSTRLALEGEFNTLEDLQAALDEVEARENEEARAVVRSVMAQPVNVTDGGTAEGLTLQTLESDSFCGQVLRDGVVVVYASLIATKARIEADPARVELFAL